jgi:hypothetical protein
MTTNFILAIKPKKKRKEERTGHPDVGGKMAT